MKGKRDILEEIQDAYSTLHKVATFLSVSSPYTCSCECVFAHIYRICAKLEA